MVEVIEIFPVEDMQPFNPQVYTKSVGGGVNPMPVPMLMYHFGQIRSTS